MSPDPTITAPCCRPACDGAKPSSRPPVTHSGSAARPSTALTSQRPAPRPASRIVSALRRVALDDVTVAIAGAAATHCVVERAAEHARKIVMLRPGRRRARIAGSVVTFASPAEALAAGISMVGACFCGDHRRREPVGIASAIRAVPHARGCGARQKRCSGQSAPRRRAAKGRRLSIAQQQMLRLRPRQPQRPIIVFRRPTSSLSHMRPRRCIAGARWERVTCIH